jgi:hypothetical protein
MLGRVHIFNNHSYTYIFLLILLIFKLLTVIVYLTGLWLLSVYTHTNHVGSTDFHVLVIFLISFKIVTRDSTVRMATRLRAEQRRNEPTILSSSTTSFFHSIQTVSGAHRASCQTDTSLKVTAYLRLVPRLRMRGAYLHYPTRLHYVIYLMKHRDNFIL